MQFSKGQGYRIEKEFEERVVQVNRVSKKTKGGNRIAFSVLMVVGNKKGQVGVGLGKALDVVTAIHKGIGRAKKDLFEVPMKGTTIPHQVRVKLGAAQVLLKPAPPGTGIKAGGAVRAVVETAGIKDVVGKVLGTKNQASNVYATMEALKQLRMTSLVAQFNKKDENKRTKEKKNKEVKTKVKNNKKKE